MASNASLSSSQRYPFLQSDSVAKRSPRRRRIDAMAVRILGSTSIGQYLTIALDDTVIESATIQSEIDNQAEVIGIASLTAAQNLAAWMRYGPLPVALQVIGDERVAAAESTQPGG